METENMNTQNLEKIIFPRKFGYSAKEQRKKDILSILFSPNNFLLGSRDTDIIRMILIEDKNLKEIGDKFNLTPTTISHIFNRAIRRINFRYAAINEQLENAVDMQKEISFLTKKLRQYENENIISSLPLETKEILYKGIKEFNFSVRAINTFKAARIDTLADLVKFSKRDLLRFRNVGKVTVIEINEFLKAKGLSWEMKM